MLLIIRLLVLVFLYVLIVPGQKLKAQVPLRTDIYTEVHLQDSFSKISFCQALKKPLLHSFSIMAVSLSVLLIGDLADDKMSYSNFKRAFTEPPVLDDDGWVYNYFSHPLMGSETYLRAREAGFGYFGSFAFSSAMSLTWEFLIESWTEQPSIQDLLITSTTGSVLGELRYHAKSKMNKKYYWIIDPINSLYMSIGNGIKKDKSMTIGFDLRFSIASDLKR